MNEKPIVMANGRVMVGAKELFAILGIVFLAGGGWITLQAHGQTIDNLRLKVDGDHDLVTAMKEKIETITSEQKHQGEKLDSILLLLQRGLEENTRDRHETPPR